MKKIVISAFLLLCSFSLSAQIISVTATLTDSDSQTWNNATCTITPYNSTGQPVYYQGTAIPLNPTCSISGSGVLTASLYNTTTLDPATSQYRFTIQSQTSAKASTFLSPVITSNLSSTLSAFLTAPRFPVGNTGSFGYLDVEAQPSFPGSNYFNVTNNISRQWTGSAWQNLGGGTGYVGPTHQVALSNLGETVYQNTFGAPLYIAVTAGLSGGANMTCITDSSPTPGTIAAILQTTGDPELFCVVLPGNYYEISHTTGGAITIAFITGWY